MKKIVPARLLIIGCLLLALSGCSLSGPKTGMGAVFTTPEEAFVDALGPGGWLTGGRVAQLVLHQQLPTPEGRVVLYSGLREDKLHVGLADAKPVGRGWSAHGMFSLGAPEREEGKKLSCGFYQQPISGTRVSIVTGRTDAATVQHVEVVFDDGAIQRAAVREGRFMLLAGEGQTMAAARAVDAQGTAVEQLSIDDCEQAS